MKKMISLVIVVLSLSLALFISFDADAAFKGAVVKKDLAAQTMVVVQETAISYDLALIDTDGIYNPLYNTRLTVPARTSIVKLCTSVRYSSLFQRSGYDVWLRVRFFKNGTTPYFDGNGQDDLYPVPVLDNTGAPTTYWGVLHACTAPIRVVPGDYFEVDYTLRNDFDGIIYNDRRTWFSMEILE